MEEATAAESKADFIHKLRIAQKEARETLYWIRLIQASDPETTDLLSDLQDESDQIVRIISKIIANTQKR